MPKEGRTVALRVDVVAALALGLAAAGLGAERADAQGLLDPAQVEAFFDAQWREVLRRDGAVPGAVVAVVHDGAVVLIKGYGVSDADTREPTDAGETRIRIGSVSKLFTALTALALVDAGKLELDRDANEYLTDVQVPSTFAEPVTLRALLSHRGGFDGGGDGYMTFAEDDLATPAHAYTRALVRVRPPNREYAYDNRGVGLLGYVAGVANGTSFARAVEEHVTAPLGLPATTVGLPGAQRERLAACHSWDAAGALVKCVPKFMREGFQGNGDITTTAPDMARFMLALLDGGCLEGRCVLDGNTFEQLTDLDLNRLHPLAQGAGFMIYEKSRAGRLGMGHDGGQDGFSTSLILFPATRTGVFMSLFSYVGIPLDSSFSQVFDFAVRNARHDLLGASLAVETRFAETFLPQPEALSRNLLRSPAAAAEAEIQFLAGRYFPTDGESSVLLLRFGQAASGISAEVRGGRVWIDDEGPLEHAGGGVLVASDGSPRWLFTRTEHDVFLQRPSDAAFRMYVQKPWHWNAALTVLPLAIPILLAAPALLFGVLSRQSVPRRRLGLSLAFAGAAVLVGLYFELEHFSANYYPDGPTAALVAWRLVLNVGWLAAAAALWTLAANPRELLGRIGGARAAARSLLVVLFALSAAVVVVLLPYWGLIGNFTGV